MGLPPATIETTIKVYLRQMRVRLDEAASIAKAADICADAGSVGKGIEIACPYVVVSITDEGTGMDA